MSAQSVETALSQNPQARTVSTSSLMEMFETAASNGGVHLEHFCFTHERYPERTFYYAAVPGYTRFFFRDAAYTALMTKNIVLAENSLEIAASHQGKSPNPRTGERKGLPPHELDPETQDGVDLNGKNTLYNASDNAALFLTLHEQVCKWTGEKSLLNKHIFNIGEAIGFIKKQVNHEGLFVEDPAFCGADRFALAVTYWKDSKFPGREDGQPAYPVVIPLLHFQNLAGIRSAARLLNSPDLVKMADQMLEAGLELFDEKTGNFPLAIDSKGKIEGISSDGLHSLFFLEPGDLPVRMVEKIIDSSKVLETDIGYRVLDPTTAQKVDDPYHAETVWNHEQAVIQIAALKYYRWAIREGNFKLAKKLKHVIEVTKRGDDLIEESRKYKEIFFVTPDGKYDPSRGNGNNHQLWVWGGMQAKKSLKNALPLPAEVEIRMTARHVSRILSKSTVFTGKIGKVITINND